MAKNNAVNLDITNNADGFDISGGTTVRKLTVSGGDVTFSGGSPTKGDVLAADGTDFSSVPVGTNGQVLTADSTQARGVKWSTVAGSGDVTKVGTPVDSQIGVWTGDGTIEGDTALTFDTSTDTLAVAASGKFAFGAVNILSDSAGTTTLSNIDALDATTEATIEAAIDTLSNLTTVGTLTSGNADAIVSASSTTTAGKIEVATAAEINTGTDAARAVSPDTLAGSNFGIRYIQATVVDYTTATTTGDGKAYFHIPPGLNGMNLVYVHAEVITAGTTGTTDIQIHNVTQAADMLTTKLTIDSAETGSDTAATAAVIDTANDDVATNDVIRVDVDAVSTTPAQGLIVTLGFQLP